jgi:hypothetical protein
LVSSLCVFFSLVALGPRRKITPVGRSEWVLFESYTVKASLSFRSALFWERKRMIVFPDFPRTGTPCARVFLVVPPRFDRCGFPLQLLCLAICRLGFSECRRRTNRTGRPFTRSLVSRNPQRDQHNANQTDQSSIFRPTQKSYRQARFVKLDPEERPSLDEERNSNVATPSTR